MNPRLGAGALLLAALVGSSCSAMRSEAPAPPALAGLRTELSDRQFIQSAALRIEREDPESGVKAASELARSIGGYVQASSGEFATLMVPSTRLDEALTGLAALGKVEHRDVRTEDVTEARRDLVLRLDNLQRTRRRYLELLEKAETVEATLAVERELERLTLEVERLSAQLESVETRVELAAVNVSFAKPVRPGPIGWVFYGIYAGVKWLFVWS